ncbi:polymerase, partial [Bifidobacterium longum]
HYVILNVQVRILCLLLLNVYISFLLNISAGNLKLISHSAAWTTSILLFFVVPFSLFKRIPINKINHVLYIIYYIAVSFSILEYLDVNVFNIGLTNLIPRPDGSDYDPIFIWGIRSRSFFAESGYFAMFVLLYFPVICYMERGRLFQLKNIVLIVLTILAMLFAFSTTFFILSISYLLLLLFSSRKYFALKILLLFSVLLLFYSFYKQELDAVFDIIILSKFDSTSFSSRTSLNEDSLNYIREHYSLLHLLWGYGPGSYDYLNLEAAISTYVNIIRDLGLIGLFLFVCFYCSVFVKLLFSKSVFSKYMLFSLFSSIVYLHTNTSYYYAFSWFVIILSLNVENIEKYES